MGERMRWSVVALLLVAGLAGAQEGGTAGAGTVPDAGGEAVAATPATAAPAAAPVPVAVAPVGVGPRVVAVHRLLVEEAGEDELAEAAGRVPARAVGLGAVIAVEVEGIDALLAAAGGLADVVLFLDGIALADVPPLGLRRDRGWLIFRLDRSEGSDAAWHLLLGSPSSLVRRLALTVGPDASSPIPSDVETFPLAVIHGWELAVFLVLLLAAVIGFFAAARRTDLLRDRAADVPAGEVRPFSLARCQMAWWFFLVVAAYVFIWLALAELDTITASVVGLIGIGSGTALGAGLIDAQKKQSREVAEAELAQVRAGLASPAAAPATPAAEAAGLTRQVQAARLEQRVDDLQGVVKSGSRGFWRDLLWDEGGVSLHRFQIVVWTLVLGVIFVASVFGELAMPEFSATLLGLMGISSGTYLGFKFPERQS